MIKLTKPAIPLAFQDASHITRDSSFCGICLNLSPVVAEACHGVRENLYLFQVDPKIQVWDCRSSVADLLEGVNDGCASCKVIKEAIDGIFPGSVKWGEELTGEKELMITMAEGNVLRIYITDLFVTQESGQEPDNLSASVNMSHPNASIELYCCKDESTPWPTIGTSMHLFQETTAPWMGGTAGHVPLNPFSDACFDAIQKWMDTCMRDHPFCSSRQITSHTSRVLPKRVVNVGDSVQYDNIHLKETHGQEATFLALSHCWGASSHLTTTSATIDDRKRNIPWNSIPKTFQDAIRITRRLGHQFLWIDSLCIVQDDAHDWEEESAKMGEIYQSAFLVLAATRAPDGDAGCLGERKASHCIDGTDMNDKPFHVYAREVNTHNVHFWGVPSAIFLDGEAGLRSTWANNAVTMKRHYPLLTRSWCYQEALLATRILHFEEKEVVWECLTCLNCECGALHDYRNKPLLLPRQIAAGIVEDPQPTEEEEGKWRALVSSYHHGDIASLTFDEVQSISDSIPALKFSYVVRQPGNTALLAQKFRRYQDDPLVRLFRKWRNIVTDYTTRQLTYDRDTFPALSGLAGKWQNIHTGRYLAGIWEHDFLSGTVWRAYGEELPIKEYIAPSWSWASARRAVEWVVSGHEFKWHIQILEKDVSLKGTNAYGQICHGYITLRGQLIEGILKSCVNGKVYTDGAVVVDAVSDRSHYIYLDRYDRGDALVGKTIYCLRLCTDKMTSKGFGGYFERGLVLRRVMEGRENYKRIGFMTMEQPVDVWEASARERVITIV